MTMPSLDYEIFTSTGERGWTATWFAHENDESMVPLRQPFKEEVTTETRVFVSIDSPKGITKRWTMKLEGYLKEREKDCEFEFGLTVAGRAKVRLSSPLCLRYASLIPVMSRL
jgi:beta-glucosidase